MKNREWLRRLPMDLLMDIVGGLIYAVGLNCFANPNDICLLYTSPSPRDS